jgi:tRNA threonylcarbamoyladenosine biosynthesis protein TsaB
MSERNAAPTTADATDGRRPWLLVIDTATSRAIVAAASPDGELLGVSTWTAGRTHGAQLLPAIGRLHGEANLRRSRIAGVIVGSGPGAFTGLRVGIATAKALAHELGVRLVGVSTAEALLEAASSAGPGESAAGGDVPTGHSTERPVLVLPAGPNDRLVVRPGEAPLLLASGHDPELSAGERLVAVDLAGRAPDDALRLGGRAIAGLAAALVRIGVERLAAGGRDDLAALVPEYVSLPRGVTRESGEVAWSRDPRRS